MVPRWWSRVVHETPTPPASAARSGGRRRSDPCRRRDDWRGRRTIHEPGL